MLTLKTSPQTVTRFAFSADGARLAVGGTGQKVHLWNLTAKKLKPTILPTLDSASAWLGFLPNGKLFALAEMGGYAVHDPVAGTTKKVKLKSGRWVGYITAEPDRSAFYGTGNEAQKWTFNSRLREVWNVTVPDKSHSVIVGGGGVVLAPKGKLIAAVSNQHDKTWLHTRDAATGKLLSDKLIANSMIRNLTLLPDGRTLVFVRERYKGAPNALMVGSASGKFKVVHQATDVAQFTALALHPSGKWLAAGQDDGTVRTFDTATWAEASAYQWPVKPVAGLAFSPDGLKAAAGGDAGQFVVWDVDL